MIFIINKVIKHSCDGKSYTSIAFFNVMDFCGIYGADACLW